MNIDVDQAAKDFSNCLGLPADVAAIRAASDRRGAYISVRIAPGFLGRVAMPPVFRGFPVNVTLGRPLSA